MKAVRKPRSGSEDWKTPVAAGLGAAGGVFLVLPGSATFATGILALIVSAFLLPDSPDRHRDSSEKASPLPGVFLVALTALFFRTWRLDQDPAGLHIDAAMIGETALRLGASWPAPQDLMPINGWPSLLAYPLRAWFSLFGADRIGLLGFFIFVSLLALPPAYSVFRRWCGNSTALAALFLWSAMRWNVTIARSAHMAAQMALPMFLSLYLLHRGLESGRRFWWILAGIPVVWGLYTYQAFKLFPFFIALFLVRELKERDRPRGFVWGPLLFAFLALLLAAPLGTSGWLRADGGIREAQLSILKLPAAEAARVFGNNLIRLAFFFNREGDTYALVNVPGRAVLDPVTGALFITGFAWALRHPGRRENFHALCGFVIMALPGLLSVDGPQSTRMAGAAPFVALLAAKPIPLLLESTRGRIHRILRALAATLAMGLVVINAQNLFIRQSTYPDCRAAHSERETRVGEWVARSEGDEIRLAPRFFQHPTVRFLASRTRSIILPFDPAAMPDPSPDRKIVFVWEGSKTGWGDWLEAIYPGGLQEAHRAPNGTVLFRVFRAPPESRNRPRRPAGFRGEYRPLDPLRPRVIRTDPVLDFSFLEDFPEMGGPFFARWRGRLRVPQEDDYEFLLLTTGEATLRVDGKVRIPAGHSSPVSVRLKRGFRDLSVEYRSPSYFTRADGEGLMPSDLPLKLAWRRRGEERFRCLPEDTPQTREP